MWSVTLSRAWDKRSVVYRELNKKVLRWREKANTLNTTGAVKVGGKCDFYLVFSFYLLE